MRVARIDLAGSALDPPFGAGGVAELQVSALAWTSGPVGAAAWTYDARVLAARAGAISIAVDAHGFSVGVPPPMGYLSTGISYVKLLVDD